MNTSVADQDAETETVAMPVEMYERICKETNSDSEATVSAWVQQAIRVMLSYCDSQQMQTINVDIDVPDPIADRVRLDYERRCNDDTDEQSRDEYLADALDEFFSIKPRYMLDDEIIEGY